VYLRTVGPFYGCFGAAMILYFCAQGAGKMLWPFIGGIARLLLAALGGWLAVRQLGTGFAGLAVMVAASYAVFAAINVFAFRGVRG
jgi:Na+-driven multidrug efflux pump